MNFAVIGAGAWGTAFALHLARLGHAVKLVPRRAEQAAALVKARENCDYLPGVPLPVQLVALDTTANGRDLLTHLTDITDLPACVSYTVCAGQRVFHVPERGFMALRTHWIHAGFTCKARRAKYVARGYDFYGVRPWNDD